MAVWNRTRATSSTSSAFIRVHWWVLAIGAVLALSTVLFAVTLVNQNDLTERFTARNTAASGELASCSNGLCEPELGENTTTCPNDCGALLVAGFPGQTDISFPDDDDAGKGDQCQFNCGDGVCCRSGGETVELCTTDCPFEGGDGGDGDSGGGGECNLQQTCGDGICDANCEGGGQCRADCGDVCGDNVCGPSEIDDCCNDCTVGITCGDGICGGCEQGITDPNLWCSEDCGPLVTPTTPPTATDIPPTATNTPVPVLVTATSTATNTPEPVSQPDTPTPSPTLTLTPSATPEEIVECGFVDREDMPPEIVEQYEEQAEGQILTSIYYVCPEPPEVVSIPINNDLNAGEWYDFIIEDYSFNLNEEPEYTSDEDWFMVDMPGEIVSFAEIGVEDASQITLYDCSASSCEEFQATTFDDTLLITVSSSTDGEPQCEQGCIYAIEQVEEEEVEPEAPRVPFIPILLILAGLILISIFLFTRRGRDDEEDDFGSEIVG